MPESSSGTHAGLPSSMEEGRSTHVSKPSPEEHSWFFSKLFFCWLGPLISSGYKTPLVFEDLYALPSADQVEPLEAKLEEIWNAQKEKGDSYWRLAFSLWGLVQTEYLLIGVMVLISVLLQNVGPVILSFLLIYADPSRGEQPVWRGVALVLTLAASIIISTICSQFSYFWMARCGIRVKAALMSLLYQKSLRLGNVSKGNANNILNVDPQKIKNAFWFLHRAWSMPLQSIIIMALLINWLGWATVAAVLLMVSLGPILFIMSKKFGKSQDDIMRLMDIRVKKITEYLQGILLVKLSAWEPTVADAVDEVRAREVGSLKSFSYLLAGFMTVIYTFQPLMASACYTVYALSGNTLQAHLIFPSLALFGTLMWVTVDLPWLTSKLAEARTSLIRLNAFLRREELYSIDRAPRLDESMPVQIANGHFEWLEHDRSEYEDEERQKMVAEGLRDSSGLDDSAEKGARRLGGGDEMVSLLGADVSSEDDSELSREVTSLRLGATASDAFQLADINLSVAKGELVAVIGRVGSGKSSLISALLGELHVVDPTHTKVRLSGRVSYVGQRCWVRNATLRDNILYHLPFDSSRYARVIDVCALGPDLKMLPGGDQTEIGEKGVNLSGGQKLRVSLARAVYRDSDVYLFDDPLSAVDAHVGRHLFTDCIRSALSGKTRVMVTHQLQYLPLVDRIVVMHEGRIQQIGTYHSLVDSGFDFAALLSKQSLNGNAELDGLDGPAGAVVDAEAHVLPGSSAFYSSRSGDGPKVWKKLSSATLKAIAPSSRSQSAPNLAALDRGRLVDEEERAVGAVRWSTYWAYIRTTGSLPFIATLGVLSLLLAAFRQVVGPWWLSRWSDAGEDASLPLYLGVYLGINVGAVLLFASVRQFMWAKGTLDCSQRMHARLLRAVLRAPMSFFYSTPTGRIVNRFSKDIEAVDTQIPDLMSDWVNCWTGSYMVLLTICYSVPWALLGLVPIGVLYYYVQQYFRATSRELGRLQSLASSPLYAQYSETLDGLVTIRAYGCEGDMVGENTRLVEAQAEVDLIKEGTNRWLGLRTELIGSAVVVMVAGAVVATRLLGGWFELPVGLVGLALTLAINMNGQLNWAVRAGTMLESAMNRIERILHYQAIPSEAADVIEGCCDVPADWPAEGGLEFDHVSLRYREDLPPVLCDLSFRIRGGEKIGIVGRTGAGKSSITNALFRLVDVSRGRIVVDGIDILNLGLRTLRSRLTIIPQDPMLFSGTLRSNLDPQACFRSAELWDALQRVRMDSYVRGLDLRLDAVVEPSGSNFSVGQRQLLCMARALLECSSIIVMDEATASVDSETDAVIQQTVRTTFADCTVLTIAHRLDTIMDSDRVLVLDAGEVMEFDSPHALLQLEEGHLYSLVEDTGPRTAAYLRELAACAFGSGAERKSDAELDLSQEAFMREALHGMDTPFVP